MFSAERTEEASKAIATKRELQSRVEQISRDFEEEKTTTFEITQDMTRQYKGMQEELLSRINKLEETVQQLHDQLADADARQERMMKDKNQIIQMKDDEISQLKAKMDDMAEEFGEMLRVGSLCYCSFHHVVHVLVLLPPFNSQETLEKMRERIEITSGNFDNPELPIQRRMEELKLDHK